MLFVKGELMSIHNRPTGLPTRLTGTLLIFLAFALLKAQSSHGFIHPTSLTPKALAVACVVASL
jgi:hypothetical protein